MSIEFLSDLDLRGSLTFLESNVDFPANPRIGTVVLKGTALYAYIKLGSMETWYPFANRTQSYIHTQGAAALVWQIQHNLGTTNVWVQAKKNDGTVVSANIDVIDENLVTITFTTAMVGTAVVVAPDTIDVPEVKAQLISVGNVQINTSTILIDGSPVLTNASIDAQLAAEATARQSIDTSIQASIASEITARVAADSTIRASIDAETTARIAADTTLQANIDQKADKATTLSGYGITDAAPSSHVGSGGSAHATATTTTAGFISAADKTKLDGIADNANNYNHPVSGVVAGTYTKVDVNSTGHVTGGSQLQAGDIPNLNWSKITSGKPTTVAGYGITDAYTKTETDARIADVVGAAPAALDTLAEIAAQLSNDESAVSALTSTVSGKLDSSEVVSTAAAGKVLRLDQNSKLPASITGNASTATNVNWSGVQNTPTTLAGYGITNAYTQTQVDNAISTAVSGVNSVASADSATKLATARTISTSGDVSATATAFDGTTDITIPMTLATVADSGIGQFKKITRDSKGRITGTADVTQADIVALLGTGSITASMLSGITINGGTF